DGANIEIREQVGPENVFIFGLTVEEIRRRRAQGPYRPGEVYRRSADVRRVLDAFRGERFSPGAPRRHERVYHRLLSEGGPYYHLADLESALAAHDEATALYRDRPAWAGKAVLNVARVGKFSSDRTIREYAEGIWNLRPVP